MRGSILNPEGDEDTKVDEALLNGDNSPSDLKRGDLGLI